MRNILVIIVMILIGGCTFQMANSPNFPSSTGIVYAGGDGSSLENAIIIKGVPDSFTGIKAESDWIRANHPEWRKGIQTLVKSEDKVYDCIGYTTLEGVIKTIYFDITDFFGKY